MGYCDPESGLPSGMPNHVRDNIQQQAAHKRELDLKWMAQPHEGRAIAERKFALRVSAQVQA